MYRFFGVYILTVCIIEHKIEHMLVCDASNMNKSIVLDIPDDCLKERYDVVLSRMLPEYSRSKIQQWIKKGQVTCQGKPILAKDKARGGEHIELNVELESVVDHQSEPMDLDIVYEDADFLVVNKPAGLVVHPGAGNAKGTLLNGLLHHDANLETVPRCGIIHRLDKDTTGLLVVAKTLEAHQALSTQMQNRTISRIYQAVVCGEIIAGGCIDRPLGRHPKNRLKMSIMPEGMGREAVSHYRVLNRFQGFTHVQVQLETGRTHQIRVHMSAIRHPLLGDPLYGQRLRLPKQASDVLIDTLRQFKRPALHAAQLSFIHPISQQPMSFEAPLPSDFKSLLACLGVS